MKNTHKDSEVAQKIIKNFKLLNAVFKLSLCRFLFLFIHRFLTADWWSMAEV